MGNRPAKGGDAKLEESKEDFNRRPLLSFLVHPFQPIAPSPINVVAVAQRIELSQDNQETLDGCRLAVPSWSDQRRLRRAANADPCKSCNTLIGVPSS